MVKIYSLGAGTAVEQNGVIQVVPRGAIEVSTTGNRIQLNRFGLGAITELEDFADFLDANGQPLGANLSETLEALSYFFFDNLEGYQQPLRFDTAQATAGQVVDTGRTLDIEIGRAYQLEAKAYAKAINDTESWAQVIRTSNVAKVIDQGGGVPLLVGSTVPSLDPAQSTTGGVVNGFLFADAGAVKYRVLANASVPALTWTVLFSITEF